jgi:branched-chain amino acid transport system ATP-binding protein
LWPAPATTAPILALEGINTFYGPAQVHFDLDLAVGAGQIVCLLGGNASGKPTTMKIILGLVKPASGSLRLDGQPINGLPTPQIVRRGVGSVPEARRLFGEMSVRENLLMGAFTWRDPKAIAQDLDRVLELIAAINREGVAVFMVEQNASLALEIAHHVYVLQTGRIVLQGQAAELRADRRIRDAYLGGQDARQ